MEAQESALEAYQYLWNNFEKDEAGNPIYPEYYAGEYIEGDKLVILLTVDDKAEKEKYVSICDNSEAVLFKKADYSMQELERFNLVVAGMLQDYAINYYGVDKKNNQFQIGVSEADYQRLCNDDRIIGKPIILHIAEENTICASVYGGDRITYGTAGSAYSLCIGGTYGGNNAILTAGHGTAVNGSFYRSGSLLGTVKVQRCNSTIGNTGASAYGDYAIVQTNSSFTINNKVRNSTSTVSITGTYSAVPVGTTIYKYGATTGYAWGQVSSDGTTATYLTNSGTVQYQVSGLYLTYLNNSSSTSAIGAGDSGGCVYTKSSSVYKIHGSVSGMGAADSNGERHLMYSSPIYYAVNAGFTPKTN